MFMKFFNCPGKQGRLNDFQISGLSNFIFNAKTGIQLFQSDENVL